MNLMNILRDALNPDELERFGDSIGCDRSTIGKVSAAAGPAILTLFAKVGSTNEGASKLQRLLSENAAEAPPASDVQSLTGRGSSVLQSLLGAKSELLERAISSYTGGDTSLVGSITHYMTGVAAAALGRLFKRQNLSADGIKDLFTSQKDVIFSSVPPGLTQALSSIGAFSGVFGPVPGRERIREKSEADFVAPRPPVNGRSPRIPRVMEPSLFRNAIPLLLILAVLGSLLWFFGPRDRVGREGMRRARMAEKQTITLPNGEVLHDVPENAAAHEIASYLANPALKGDRRVVLRSMKFEPDGRFVGAESEQQMAHIAAVLRAYPQSRVVISAKDARAAAAVHHDLQKRDIAADRLSQSTGPTDDITLTITKS